LQYKIQLPFLGIFQRGKWPDNPVLKPIYWRSRLNEQKTRHETKPNLVAKTSVLGHSSDKCCQILHKNALPFSNTLLSLNSRWEKDLVSLSRKTPFQMAKNYEQGMIEWRDSALQNPAHLLLTNISFIT
jgi:hypothetical protein